MIFAHLVEGTKYPRDLDVTKPRLLLAMEVSERLRMNVTNAQGPFRATTFSDS